MISNLRQLHALAALSALTLGSGLTGCAAPVGPPPSDLLLLPPAGMLGIGQDPAPFIIALGTAQDGGLPQIGCARECCTAAREDPSRVRLVTSLLLVDPRDGRRWLFDATPDIARQVERARGPGLGGPPEDAPGRPALFDGIFITHAHLGHVVGLLQLGREAYGSAPVPLIGTERMAGFLGSNGPWSLLFDGGYARPEVLQPDETLNLAEDLSVTAIQVPHRDEFTDTVAFLIRGPERSVLYLPDIDKWEKWDRRLEDVIAGVDVALVDGTFFGPAELPGRDMSQVPHPFIVETLERIAPLPEAERGKVVFTHLNHSNPATDPTSDAAAAVRAAGSSILDDGDRIRL